MGANTGKHGDRIRDTAASVSTTFVNLANSAPTGYQTFGNFYADGDVCPSYLITDNGPDWEISYGTYTASGTKLSRAATPIASSNGGAQVFFFSGTTLVSCIDPALNIDANVTGLPAGFLYTNAFTSNTLTTLAPATGTVVYVPVQINQWFSSVTIHINISALAGGAATFALGLYSNLNGQPGTRLGQATGLNGGAGGTTGDNMGIIALSSPQEPTLYWVGYVCATNAPSVYGPTGTGADAKEIFGTATISSADFTATPVGWSQASATLPSTAGSLTLMTSGAVMVGVDLNTAFPFLTLVNTSGSTVAANSIPPSVGHPFVKGQIPAGTWPQLQLTDGTPVPATIYNRIFWNDGSLMHCGFVARIPVSIAGNASVQINILNGAGNPGTSARSTADLTAGGLNLLTQLDGQDNLAGTWQSILADGLSNTNQSFGGEAALTYGDGPVGKVVRVRASYEQSGAPHGQLEGYWWAFILQDSSGGLYGIRYLPSAIQPWYNNDTPAKIYRSFTGVAIKNGASVIRDQFAPNFGAGHAQSFTATIGSTNYTLGSTSAFRDGTLIKLTTTGTLPAPLQPNTPYFAQVVNGTVLNFTPQEGFVGGVIQATTTGTGTHTVTPFPYLVHFGGETFTDVNAMYNYIQGAGSVAAEAPLRWQWDKPYVRSTKVIPALDLTISPTSSPAVTRYWNNPKPCQSAIGGTGERDDIGVLTAWAARHFLTQAAVDELNVRVIGLNGMTLARWFRDTTTKSIPVCNNTVYPGMPAPNNSFQWVENAAIAVGFTPPNPTAWEQNWSSVSFDHMPEMTSYAYWFTAEPHLMDTSIMAANQALMGNLANVATAEYSLTNNIINAMRNIIVNGVQYNGCLVGGQERQAAWATRTAAQAAVIARASPENPSQAVYLMDVFHKTVDVFNAFNAVQVPYWQANGVFQCWQGQRWASWQNGYFIGSLANAYAITEYAPALTLLNHIVKWPAHVKNTFGGWHVAPSDASIRTGDVAASDAPINTADNQYGVTNAINLSWTSGGHFSLPSQIDGYVLTNGDIYNWDVLTTAPAGFHYAGVPYYVVNANAGAGTFSLSATLGGSAIPITDTNSGSSYIIWSVPNATNSCANSSDASGYLPNQLGHLKLANSVGASVDASTIADQQTRFNASGISYVPNPKYAFNATP